MAKDRLKKPELDRLLGEYFAERRMLMFKLDKVRTAIVELKRVRVEKEVSAEAAAESRKTRTTGRRKPGPRKKRTVKAGYRLNAWDSMIKEAITRSDRLLTKQELLAISLAWAKREEPKSKAADVEAKLTRTLQKLSGRRGVLGKHRTGKMRGLHYGIMDWFFHGKLRQEHQAKVRLPARK
jgi:hypothetical protein